jgi:glycosyltransferase involved in cell wall biosynthesis
LADSPATGTSALRVLHVVESFGGGVFEIVRLLAERLAAGGDQVAIAYGRRPETPVDVRASVDGRVDLYALPWVTRRPHAQPTAGRAIRRTAAEWRPDVVHLHSSFAGVVGLAALRGRVPLVYTPHGYSFTMRDQGRLRPGVYRAVERRVARGVDVVGAVSETEARAAREVLGAPRVAVVPNGIPELDPGALPPAAKPERPRVICMGRVDEARRPESCARILRSLSDVAEVAWVGGGGRREGADRPLIEAGITPTGWLGRAEALAWLGGSTAYLHWAAWDGQPVTVLEAMARDVAVVGSDIPPIRELLGPTGVCGSEAEAIELLRSVLTDPDRRAELIDSQRATRARYGADRMARDWQDLYRRLISPGRMVEDASAGFEGGRRPPK